MKIKVDKLKSVTGIRTELNFSLTKEEIGDTTVLNLSSKPLVFQGVLENYDRTIKVTGEITCFLQGLCDRCGEETEYEVKAEFSEAFTNLPEKIREGEGDQSLSHFFEGDEIDLLPYVEQSVFLAMPMKVLCKEECMGLCPQCGQNLNIKKCSCDNTPIDPRLAVLGDLFKEVD
ncbi:MAG: DUF177 domain-containing protein [Clostridiales bacterium]